MPLNRILKKRGSISLDSGQAIKIWEIIFARWWRLVFAGRSSPSDCEFWMMSRLLKAILIRIDSASSEQLSIPIPLEEK
jgi:hypothetical protein